MPYPFSLTYSKVLGDANIVFYKETLQSKGAYSYTIEQEQKIINFIKSGDYSSAKESIENILSENIDNGNSSPLSIQFLYYDLIGSIIKAITKEDEEKMIFELKPLKRLLNCENIKDMDILIYELLEKFCEYKREEIDKLDNSNLIENIEQYINDNLFFEDLSVTLVGEKFSTTPAYLSKMFKNEKSESILQYINRKRIEESKKLLANENFTLNQIANKIGYLHVNTYIRIFKRYEGITPGQYRKQNN